jgi:hypothetical protein
MGDTKGDSTVTKGCDDVTDAGSTARSLSTLAPQPHKIPAAMIAEHNKTRNFINKHSFSCYHRIFMDS